MRIITLLLLICTYVSAQVPQLQSLPNSTNVLFLDFDGAVINNPNWSASTINAASSGFTTQQIRDVFNSVANYYWIFDLNVTTIESVYNAAQTSKRGTIVLTPTDSWYGGVGGVAFVGAWGWQAYQPGFVFTKNITSNGQPDFKSIANATAHEAGHMLYLNHHSENNAQGQAVAAYYYGKGEGETSFAPQMGVAYGRNIGAWVCGPISGPCGWRMSGGFNMPNWQDDIAELSLQRIGGKGYTPHPKLLSLKADDIGNTTATAKNINIVNNAISDSGMIGRSFTNTTSFHYIDNPPVSIYDEDYFRFTTTTAQNFTINCRPFSFRQTDNWQATMDTRLIIRNASGNIIAQDSNLQKLSSSITLINQPAGTYFIQVGSSANPNMNAPCYDTDPIANRPQNKRYNSVGRYYITGTFAPASSLPVVTIGNISTTCAGVQANITNQSQNATSYVWNLGSGATPATSTAISPNVTYSTGGTKTVTLTATNVNGSTTATKNFTITNPMQVSINAPSSVQAGTPTTITANATGGTAPYTYKWAGGQTTQSITITQTVTTSYSVTVTSTNGCTGDGFVTISISVTPPPPTCTQPTITASTTCQAVTVSIAPNTNYQSISFSYAVNGGAQNTQTLSAPYTTTLPIQASSVVLRATATCTNGTKSATSEITYTVPAISQAPPDFTLSSSGGRWTTTFVNNGSKFYAIRFRNAGTTAWSETTTNGLTITRPATIGTTIEVQSQSRCQTGSGAWSTTKTITIK
jgi:hypothetical protein